MSVSTWLRDKLIGPPDPSTKELVGKVQEGVEGLAEATRELSKGLKDIKAVRKADPRNEKLSAIIDDLLAQVSKKKDPR